MKSKRYYIIITWFSYTELTVNKTTVIDVEESMIEKIMQTLPLSNIAKIRVEENNNEGVMRC